MLNRTDDMYDHLERMADPPNNESNQRLTLSRLRSALEVHAPVSVDRRSPFTQRTLLQVVCSGEVPEAQLVNCVKFLLHHENADPNILATHEHPYADRPTLYFAIARAMPKLVTVLLQAGASVHTRVQGAFRLTFDPTSTIAGNFTPLEYAREIFCVEVEERQIVVPPYWVTQLRSCIRILECATAGKSGNPYTASSVAVTKRATVSTLEKVDHC